MAETSGRSGLDRREFLARAGAAAVGALAGCVGPERADPEARSRPHPASVPLIYDAQGGLFVDVQLEGRPARLLLDTGASRSTLARQFVVDHGLETRAGDPVEGTAGVVDAEQAAASIELPGLEPRRIDFVVYAFSSLDPACVGILGNDVLGERPFRIAYREAALTWDADEPKEPIALELDHGIPRVVIAIAGVDLDVRLDTGAALAPGPDVYLNVTRAQAATLGLAGRPVKIFTATGTGGARLELPVHRVRDVAIAGRSFDEAFVIVQPPIGYFARADAVGFLGNSVLDKLDPWFDYRGRLFGTTRAG